MFVHALSSRPRGSAPSGFTLVELMVVIAIAAILVGIAVPGLSALISANQLSAITDNLATALNEARSEAAKLGTSVTLTAGSGTQDWGTAGWTAAAANPAGAGTLGTLRTGAAVPTGFTIFANAPLSASVTFDSTGRVAGATQAGEIVICQKGGPAQGGTAKMIMIALNGRVRIAQSDSSGNPLDVNGLPVTTCQP